MIVNTCGFITPAVEESLNAIGEALDATGKVIVTGCLGERPEKIMERHPKVAAITGSEAVDDVMGHVRTLLPIETDAFTGLLPVAAPGMRAGAEQPAREDTRHGDVFAPSVKLTPRHYAYVKIAEGCNHTCSFCIIPKLRGLQVSRDAGAVLYEAFRLIAGGTKELMIISQDTSAYGVDVRYRESEFQGEQVRAHLTDLAVKLGEMGAWVRMHYVYPYPHVEKIVELMAAGKILPYLDVPLQHASPKVLRAMRRPGAGKQLDTIRRWREICPELVIRSTFIVGFPGETEADFQELLTFLEDARLDRVGPSRTATSRKRTRTRCPARCRRRSRRSASRASWRSPSASAPRSSPRRSGPSWTSSSTSSTMTRTTSPARNSSAARRATRPASTGRCTCTPPSSPEP